MFNKKILTEVIPEGNEKAWMHMCYMYMLDKYEYIQHKGKVYRITNILLNSTLENMYKATLYVEFCCNIVDFATYNKKNND